MEKEKEKEDIGEKEDSEKKENPEDSAGTSDNSPQIPEVGFYFYRKVTGKITVTLFCSSNLRKYIKLFNIYLFQEEKRTTYAGTSDELTLENRHSLCSKRLLIETTSTIRIRIVKCSQNDYRAEML